MGVRVKSLQRRVLVVGINRYMSDALVLQELDEVHGEETLPTPPFPLRIKSSRFMGFGV